MGQKYLMTAILLQGKSSEAQMIESGYRKKIEDREKILRKFFLETIVIVRDRAVFSPPSEGVMIYEDLVPGRGVLGALYTGLLYASYSHCYVVSEDDDGFVPGFIRSFVEAWDAAYDLLCLQDSAGGLAGFPALYRRSSRSVLGALLVRGENRLDRYPDVASVKVMGRTPVPEKLECLRPASCNADVKRAAV